MSLVADGPRRGSEPSRFTLWSSAGSAPPADLPPNVVTTYGLTETGSGVVYDGVALDGVEVAVDAGTAEIRLRGPMLLRAYRDGTVAPGGQEAGSPRATPAGSTPAAGCTSTGGSSDLIITGGENVWPGPVEAVLRRPSRGRPRSAVAGRPDPEWGAAGGGLGRSRRPGRPAHARRLAGAGHGAAGAPTPPPASWSSSTSLPGPRRSARCAAGPDADLHRARPAALQPPAPPARQLTRVPPSTGSRGAGDPRRPTVADQEHRRPAPCPQARRAGASAALRARSSPWLSQQGPGEVGPDQPRCHGVDPRPPARARRPACRGQVDDRGLGRVVVRRCRLRRRGRRPEATLRMLPPRSRIDAPPRRAGTSAADAPRLTCAVVMAACDSPMPISGP